jgi:CheY-like chemotaxis protein
VTAAPATPADLRGVRVLAAEDDPVNQLLIRDLLRRRGAEVTLAATGAEAVAAAAGTGFDIVLMDIRMPEMDGLTACRRIRALPGGERLPIVALTAHALAEERERCLAAGMDGYLTKPIEPEALYDELRRRLHPGADALAVSRPVAAAPATTPALPGFDAANVRRWLDQAPDAWFAMVRTFVDEYSAAEADIATALDAGDRPRAGALLHRLRGAGGALGAEELAAAAGRLEQALASDGPVDADLRFRFFASAAATRAVLTRLDAPAPEAAPTASTDSQPGEPGSRLRELAALLEAGNTRALDHLPWLERWVDTEAPPDARELLWQIEALDFPAALQTLRGLEEDVFSGSV